MVELDALSLPIVSETTYVWKGPGGEEGQLTLYMPIIAILDIWKTTLFMKANLSCTTDSSMYGL